MYSQKWFTFLTNQKKDQSFWRIDIVRFGGCLNPGQSREAAELMILSRGQEKKNFKNLEGEGRRDFIWTVQSNDVFTDKPKT